MMNSEEIEHGLTRLGFDVNVDKVRIHSAHRDDMEHPFYIKTPGSKSTSGVVKKAPLVVHSDYLEGLRISSEELYGINPITEEYFHNSNMENFPTRIQTGEKPTHYGLAVNVMDQEALSRFVVWLGSLADMVMPVASALDDIENAEVELETASHTERQSIVKSRLGQGKFRDNLINYWSGCAVSARVPHQAVARLHKFRKARYVQWPPPKYYSRRGL